MLNLKVFTFNPLQENTYVLFNEEEAIIIDPGCYYDEEREALLSFITSNDLKPALLLNTHCHLDHTFGNKWVSETFKLELHIHPNEQNVLALAPSSGLMFNLPFDNYNGTIKFIDERSPVKFGEDELTVLFTPGHSPGSVCFYNATDKYVIGGDVLFRDSIGRTDIPGGDHKALLNSIRQNLFILPEDVTVYPGHGPSTTIGYEKRYNQFLQ
jgi:glyoxylase-like metal-dependent hydrolase (beta-lactamase superfamily II)